MFKAWLRRWLGVPTVMDLADIRRDMLKLSVRQDMKRGDLEELICHLENRIHSLESSVRTLALKDAYHDAQKVNGAAQ